MSFSYNISEENRIIRASFIGRLMSSEDNEAISNEIDTKINEGYSLFILDLEKLEYMNSSGLNVFVSILTKARNKGGDAVIYGVSDKINQLLIITKLNSVFTVAETEKEAEEKLSETAKVL